MNTPTATHIELRPNRSCQLRAFVAGTRVRVQDVYALAEIQGKTPAQIVEALPSLSLAQVHAALSYYFDNRTAILTELREDDEFARQFRLITGPGALEARLNAAGQAGDPISSR
ncbi:MAG: DUF433 domain-containing protein [Planctomycetaceae bacterium]